MAFNDKITPVTARDADSQNVINEGVVEGDGVAGTSNRNNALKLNMLKVVTLTCGGSGTSTAFTFTALGLPDMADTSYFVVGPDESNLISLKATDGFTMAHQNDSTDVVDVIIVGNWDE